VSYLAEEKIHNQLTDNHLTKNKPARSAKMCPYTSGQVCKKVSDLAEAQKRNRLGYRYLAVNKVARSNIILQTWPKLHHIDLNAL
jgi:hypothetical protein